MLVAFTVLDTTLVHMGRRGKLPYAAAYDLLCDDEADTPKQALQTSSESNHLCSLLLCSGPLGLDVSVFS